MRLTDLEPRWWTEPRPAGTVVTPEHRKLGVTFLCPLCQKVRIGGTGSFGPEESRERPPSSVSDPHPALRCAASEVWGGVSSR